MQKTSLEHSTNGLGCVYKAGFGQVPGCLKGSTWIKDNSAQL
jgi:hypothetical protein